MTDTRFAALALLPLVRPGDQVLCVASDWGALADALTHLGASVTTVGPDESRLLQGRRFAVAFVDVRQFGPAGVERSNTRRLLSHVRENLTPDGVVVVAASNPLRARMRGRRSLPGAGVSLFSDPVRPWGATLRGTGLSVSRLLIPLPSLDHLEVIVHAESLRRGRDTATNSTRQRLGRFLARAGLGKWMAPDYLVIARAHRAATTSVTRAEELSSNRATIMARTHPRVVIDAESVFLKVPLSAVEERRAEQEVQRTRAAFAGPWGHYAPENVELVEQGRLTVCRYARYDAVPTSLGEYERDVLTVLDALESGETGQMSSTDLYRRLQSPREPANFEDDDLENLRSRLLGQGTLPVLIGPSHGDLHRENVLRLRGGGIKLIDWPRGEDRNPRFLDAVYATLDLHRRRAGASLSEAAIAFMKNDIEGPLAERAGELLGSMSREDVILWRMLHAMSFYAHDARRDPGNQTLQTLRRLWG